MPETRFRAFGSTHRSQHRLGSSHIGTKDLLKYDRDWGDATLFNLLSAAQRVRERIDQAIEYGNGGEIEEVHESFAASLTASERVELAQLLARI